MDILLVEDNELAIWFIQNTLKQLEFKVEVARTGFEALRLFHRGYKAILLDVGLPGIDGLEVARYIRLHETVRNLIIGISSDGEELRESCIRAGFNEVYNKPVEVHSLIKILKDRGLLHEKNETFNSRSRQIFENLPPTPPPAA